MDQVLDPLGKAAMKAGAIARGEHVLDVGCGCGSTALALAHKVGSSGRVLGVDVSQPMLERARARAGRHPNVEFLLGDAESAPLAGPFDVAFSRLGLTFFADPQRAFSHLHASIRPARGASRGGRLAFICWRRIADNPWALLPARAIASCLGISSRMKAGAPGPFAFASSARIRVLLQSTGWRSVRIERHDASLRWSRNPSLAHAARQFMRIGPVAQAISTASPARQALAKLALSRALLPHMTGAGLIFDASCWIVTAYA